MGLKRGLAGSLAMAIASTVMASEGPMVYTPIPGVREFSGQMIVRPLQVEAYRQLGVGDLDAADRDAQARRVIAERYDIVEYVWQTDEYIITVPEGMDENEVSADLMALGVFQYAEPDWIVYPIGCPNDTRFSSQWHHNANRMNSCAGWDLHTGNPTTTVGVCDTGVRTTHEDLTLNRKEGYNAVNRLWESQGGQISDINGHGTVTTGCAAANGNNGKGVSGVGWNLGHRMLRVSNDSGGGSQLSTLQHAARTSAEAGDRAVNVSYSGVDNSSNLTTATYVKSLGALLCWAAGNENRRLSLSNRDSDDLIVVGATTSIDTKASFSNYGPMVDFVAPGDGVFATCASSNTCYGSASGTSFSSPLSAGLVALCFSYNPGATPNQVESAIKNGADDLGTAGPDDTFGYGRIDVFNSLTIIGGGGGGSVCDLILKHVFKCKPGGTLKGKVVFINNSQNGTNVTVTINNSLQITNPVVGDRMTYKTCCFPAGLHSSRITNPNCPAFDRTATCN